MSLFYDSLLRLCFAMKMHKMLSRLKSILPDGNEIIVPKNCFGRSSRKKKMLIFPFHLKKYVIAKESKNVGIK